MINAPNYFENVKYKIIHMDENKSHCVYHEHSRIVLYLLLLKMENNKNLTFAEGTTTIFLKL